FELLLEYKTVAGADSGIYLRGAPQIQIWDTTQPDNARDPKVRRSLGSGGLWNNTVGAPGRDPLVHADKPFGQWNKVRTVMVGNRVSVWLNDKLVVDHAILENHFDAKLPAQQRRPILSQGSIQLQTHGGEIRWRNIFLREIGVEEASHLLTSRGG
ncbi:MAG: 3-keto-disaccharide hydrolase, partial [Opitutaceae bacterium]